MPLLHERAWIAFYFWMDASRDDKLMAGACYVLRTLFKCGELGTTPAVDTQTQRNTWSNDALRCDLTLSHSQSLPPTLVGHRRICAGLLLCGGFDAEHRRDWRCRTGKT